MGCCASNFINIGMIFVEIWRFNDFQYGGRPPYRIFEILSSCHVTFIATVLRCFYVFVIYIFKIYVNLILML